MQGVLWYKETVVKVNEGCVMIQRNSRFRLMKAVLRYKETAGLD